MPQILLPSGGRYIIVHKNQAEDTVPLVLADHLPEYRHRRGNADQSDQEIQRAQPTCKQHTNKNENKDQGRAIIALQKNQTDGQHGVEAQQQYRKRPVDVIMNCRQMLGKGDNEHDFQQLRRLKRSGIWPQRKR